MLRMNTDDNQSFLGISQLKLARVKEKNGSIIYLDFPNRLIKVKWKGIIDQETVSDMLITCSDFISVGNCSKLLFDRKDLIRFTEEAKTWIREEFFQMTQMRLSGSVSKLAIVGHASGKENFDHVVSTRVRLLFSWSKTNQFTSEAEAVNWLLSS